MGRMFALQNVVRQTSLLQLLAYGEERQAAALLLTLVKGATEEVTALSEGFRVSKCEGLHERGLHAVLMHAMSDVVTQAGMLARAAAAAAGDECGGDGSSSNSSDIGAGEASAAAAAAAAAAHSWGLQGPAGQVIRLLSFILPHLLRFCLYTNDVLEGVRGPQQQQQQQQEEEEQEQHQRPGAGQSAAQAIPAGNVTGGRVGAGSPPAAASRDGMAPCRV